MLRRPCGPFLMVTVFAVVAAGCGDTVNPGGQSSTGGGGAPSPTTGDPVITWPQPAAITNPAPLTSSQLDATANVPGSFVHSPGAGTVLSPGNQTLYTTFTPNDTTDYNSATASVTINVNPPASTASTCDSGGATGAAAYICVSTSAQKDAQIIGFSAAADGTLTPIPGSPFATPAYPTVATGSVLFGIDGGNVDSFEVHADGCLSLENSLLAAQGTAPNWSQEPQALFLDPKGANLYVSEYTPPDGLQPGLFSRNFDPANGQLTQAGAEAIGGESTLAFTSDDQYAVATYCNDRGGGISRSTRRAATAP